MPKIVDHEARRAEISRAVWRVVRREGLDAASVRAVAAEAGISAGAMRHYFADHLELQCAAMEALIEHAGGRIDALPQQGTPHERALAVLLEMAPLDDERRAEADVWFAFVAKAATEPAFRELASGSYDAIRSVVARVVSALAPGLSAADHDRATETLFALLDGLVLHAIQRPELHDADRIGAVLDAHLRALAG